MIDHCSDVVFCGDLNAHWNSDLWVGSLGFMHGWCMYLIIQLLSYDMLIFSVILLGRIVENDRIFVKIQIGLNMRMH